MCDKNITADRLKKLIDSSGKTRKEIAEQLKCDTSTITKHYNGDRDITTDFLVKYANLFEVSSDYLLGLSDVATTDTNIKDINEYTGLSEKAIDVLHFYKDYGMICPTINLLLETEMSSVLQELGYQACDIPEDVLKEMCDESNIDFAELKKIIDTKEYECLQVVSAIEKYLNIKKQVPDKILSISSSGKIISLVETDREYSRKLTVDDLFTVATVNQSEIVEKVLLDNAIEHIKALKKERNNNGNNP